MQLHLYTLLDLPLGTGSSLCILLDTSQLPSKAVHMSSPHSGSEIRDLPFPAERYTDKGKRASTDLEAAVFSTAGFSDVQKKND